MSQLDGQISLEEESQEYRDFVNKFKPKKTTDDCYTPQNIYDAVVEWVEQEYNVDRRRFVRPFWPGGDYENYDYPDDCIVVDNPPFSIVTKICRNYAEHGIKFFLFAPYLTNLGINVNGVCHIIADVSVIYENGACVNTCFLTNLDNYLIRSAPDLNKKLSEENKKNKNQDKKKFPKYQYCKNVLTAHMVGKFARHGVDFRVKPEDAYFVRHLDSQKEKGKTIYGSGYLISEKVAAEKELAEKELAEKELVEKIHIWELSEREKQIVKSLGGD